MVLSCCYACCVWSRIPFAAANLNSGLSAVKKNGGVFVMSVMITVMSFGYSVLWMVAWVGVYDATGAASATAAGGEDASSTSFGGYSVLLLLALFWTQQVFQNTIHVIVAGVVSTWWFAPDEASSCCSVAIKDSFVRATTYSFGSICFGSLLVAIIQTLRQVLESIRNNDDTNDGCAAFVVCLVDCLLQCLQGMLEYFNKFAYIYGEYCLYDMIRCFVVVGVVNLIHPCQLPCHVHNIHSWNVRLQLFGSWKECHDTIPRQGMEYNHCR